MGVSGIKIIFVPQHFRVNGMARGFAHGGIMPTIIVSLQDDPEEIKRTILHELSHIKSGDYGHGDRFWATYRQYEHLLYYP